MRLLASKFPSNIEMFGSFLNNEFLAGTIIFETETTAHAQYLANSSEGREIGALDLVIDYIAQEYSGAKRYLDFGISTEQDGRYLNQGLVAQKEMFGGRAVAHDFYEVK
jgi:lipid II:glycine glycyltransferase (peptidoglycan interpeptide bridge formation enzyme)